jgi:hypothetical protein
MLADSNESEVLQAIKTFTASLPSGFQWAWSSPTRRMVAPGCNRFASINWRSLGRTALLRRQAECFHREPILRNRHLDHERVAAGL